METKICGHCKIEQKIDQFRKRNDRKIIQSFCITCNKKYQKEHYKKNKEKYLEANKKRMATRVKWFREYKSQLVCEKCGENHPACLDFHHKNPDTKEINISYAVRNMWTIKRLEEEISKCMIICSNCHRKLHYREVLGIGKTERRPRSHAPVF